MIRTTDQGRGNENSISDYFGFSFLTFSNLTVSIFPSPSVSAIQTALSPLSTSNRSFIPAGMVAVNEPPNEPILLSFIISLIPRISTFVYINLYSHPIYLLLLMYIQRYSKIYI